jgi:flavin-binding protein dodecin
MSVVKVIELLAESPESWEAATQVAVTEASKTIKQIKSVYIEDMKAFVENAKIVRYRVNVKISFVVND